MPISQLDVISGEEDPLSFAVSQRDRDILTMVDKALEGGHTMLAYQPVINARTPNAEVSFFEGLIRILDDNGRVIPAAQFIPAVENHALGREVDCAALKHGLRALARKPDLRLSVNMSARSIGYARWMRILEDGLRKDPLIAERLILEITEGSAMQMPEIVMSFMSDLQDRGIAFALDDFGAGYTAFRYLKDFYFDILKIDGQFVRNVHQDPNNQCLTRALVSIGQQFDMFVVAEGVETREEADYLASVGIDCLQGFYYGSPEVSPMWMRRGRAMGRG